MVRSPIDYFVLDAIAFDAEQFEAIVSFLNDPDSEWQARFERTLQRPEVLAALMRLVRDGAVDVHVAEPGADDLIACGPGVWPERRLDEMFFDLSGRGRVLYLNWDY